MKDLHLEENSLCVNSSFMVDLVNDISTSWGGFLTCLPVVKEFTRKRSYNHPALLSSVNVHAFLCCQ